MNDKLTAANPTANQPLAPALFANTAEQAQALREQLQRLGLHNARTTHGGIGAAINWCATYQASVLLVDLDGETSPLQAIAELSALCDPGCPIIAMGSKQEINLYRALLDNGVLDYLAKPVTLDLLANTLERARDNVEPQRKGQGRTGRSIAVTGSAGGLGCSSVVAAMAQLLASERHTPVAVVDYDRSKGDQALLLGAAHDAGLASAMHSSEIDSRFLQRAMATVNPRLALLAQEPVADHYLAVNTDQVLNLGASLCRLYNQVIWDLPAGHPQGSLEVLKHSETRILLTELTVQGARNCQRLLQDIGDESEGQQLLLVVNPAHGSHATVEVRQFEEFVGRRIDLTLPFAGHDLADSLLGGPLALERVPLFRQALLNLADLACGRAPAKAPSRSLLRRVKGALNRRAAAI
ncbi:hypothetical protein [Pseudomonas sp. FW300-N2F2]|uniref:hypothetical protein n=1 Tax=Pseudomonas sp. FW300-N2F2 TaxID=2751320 RepID=UPI001A91E0DF|nr:hypothetical protein [Pseudomonas sp. FW300-N2F2]